MSIDQDLIDRRAEELSAQGHAAFDEAASQEKEAKLKAIRLVLAVVFAHARVAHGQDFPTGGGAFADADRFIKTAREQGYTEDDIR